MLPRYKSFAGCSSMPHQRPGSLALQRVVQILCCRRPFHNRQNKGKTKLHVVLISLLLQLVYNL